MQATNSTKHHVQCPGTVGIVHAHSLTASIRGRHKCGGQVPPERSAPSTDDLQAIQLTCKFELEGLESQQLKVGPYMFIYYIYLDICKRLVVSIDQQLLEVALYRYLFIHKD